MSAPLLGKNLVRLVYLDEAGSDQHAPVLFAGGVLIHGDEEWPIIDQRILALIEKWIPKPDRPGFIFHATDIFHGSGYFDRRKQEWADQERRILVLNDIAAIIDDLHLPVVGGSYEKNTFGGGILRPDLSHQRKGSVIHGFAVMDALIWADQWLAKFAPHELATVIHEDGTPAKRLIKATVRLLRNPDLIKQNGIEGHWALPLKRIIDTVHFAEKADARPLQLADLCAFTLTRGMADRLVPVYAFQVIYKHIRWIEKLSAGMRPVSASDAVSSSGDAAAHSPAAGSGEPKS